MLYYAGTQEQWETFVDEAELNLGDAIVICDTPFPNA